MCQERIQALDDIKEGWKATAHKHYESMMVSGDHPRNFISVDIYAS